MESNLLNYMNKRLDESHKKQGSGAKTDGPVITISREVGCGGLSISRKLAEELNKTVFCKKWTVISKEILKESANELKVVPEKVMRLFKAEGHFTFDEILAAFTDKYYKSNRVILKTVREVIRNMAIDGCCIILGRGGHIITSDLTNALHIRLVAPLPWRIKRIAEKRGISEAEAAKYIRVTEEERDIFRKYFMKDKNAVENIDLVIDISRFPADSVVKLIIASFELKGIPETIKSKVPFFG